MRTRFPKVVGYLEALWKQGRVVAPYDAGESSNRRRATASLIK